MLLDGFEVEVMSLKPHKSMLPSSDLFVCWDLQETKVERGKCVPYSGSHLGKNKMCKIFI